MYLFLISTEAGSLNGWLAIFNFNIFQSSGGSICVAPLTDMQRLTSGLWVVAMGFGFLLFNCICHFAMWNVVKKTGWTFDTLRVCCTCRPADEPSLPELNDDGGMGRVAWSDVRPYLKHDHFRQVLHTYLRTSLGFMASSYPSVTQTVFTFFSCVEIGSDSVIQVYPAISCRSDSQYLALRPFFIVLLVFVVAMPIVVFARLYNLKSRGLLYDRITGNRIVYGAWCETYHARMYYYEAFVLVRRLIVASVVLAPQFTTNAQLRFTFLCMCECIFLFLHFLFRPYRYHYDNVSEAVSLITLIMVSLFLSGAPSPLPYEYAVGLSIMAAVVGLLFLIRIVLSRYERIVTASAADAKHAAHHRANSNKSVVTLQEISGNGGGSAGQGTPASHQRVISNANVAAANASYEAAYAPAPVQSPKAGADESNALAASAASPDAASAEAAEPDGPGGDVSEPVSPAAPSDAQIDGDGGNGSGGGGDAPAADATAGIELAPVPPPPPPRSSD